MDERKMGKKLFYLLGLYLISGLTLVACQPVEPEIIVRTVIVEKEGQPVVETVVVTVEPTATPEVEETGGCCDTYRIGIYEEPLSLNYWNYLGPGNSIWTQYIISDDAAHLFEISDQRFRFVPSLAMDIPDPVDNGDGTWTISVDMVTDALWSDGITITAQDVVFTHNVCKDLKLTWYWLDFCAPEGANVVAEAVDDFTIEYTYLDRGPSLSNWQFGVAMAPILPQHFWAETVAEAYTYIEDVEIPKDARPENCQPGGLSEADQAVCDAWFAYDQAYEQAQNVLYEADALGQPVAGGYSIEEWQPGEYIRLTQNQNYYFKGAEINEYEDGTWVRIMPDSTEYLFYGNAESEQTLHYILGPYNPAVMFSIYGSQEAAFGALSTGEVDYVLNPISLPRSLQEQVVINPEIKQYINPGYNMFYLAFNMRKYPMSEYEFRQVFDIIIDRELVINQVLGQSVLPMYSTMPEANIFWHNPDFPKPYLGLERVEIAIQVLQDAGWSWQSEPYWDEFTQDVVPGTGLRMPNGELMPELTILGPGPDFDTVRATFNQWISEWARDLGMPVRSELTGRNAILNSVFVASDYDMYISGWPLGNPAYPSYYGEYWLGRNCTFETGGRNTPCFKNDNYDALVNEFFSTDDLDRAQELVFEMQMLLADQRPYIPLYSENLIDLVRENIIFPYYETLGGIESQTGFLTQAKVLLKE
jgi:peptide/nickel transport system substrate-binding protein